MNHADPSSQCRAPVTLWDRFCLIWGGPRRWLLEVLRPSYVARQYALREGECRCCGMCCRMSWRCRHLAYEDNRATCRIYRTDRKLVCQVFPIDKLDLADRDRVAPGRPCGFSFRQG
jgi:hypothetical protein